MVLNLSIRINEAQTQEMIGAKRDFFFKFIEQEVIALRYQVAQERNYETKNPKKLVEAKGLLHIMKPLRRKELLANHTMDKKVKEGNLPTSIKTLLLSSPIR